MRFEVTRKVPEVRVEYHTPLYTKGYLLIFLIALACHLTMGATVKGGNDRFTYSDMSLTR